MLPENEQDKPNEEMPAPDAPATKVDERTADIIDMPKAKEADPMAIVGDEAESFRAALDREGMAARVLGEARANFLLSESRMMSEIKEAINERETLAKAIAKRKKIDLSKMILDISQMRFMPRRG